MNEDVRWSEPGRQDLLLSGLNRAVVAQSRTNEQCIEFEKERPAQTP